MKKLLLFLIFLTAFFGCSKNDDDSNNNYSDNSKCSYDYRATLSVNNGMKFKEDAPVKIINNDCFNLTYWEESKSNYKTNLYSFRIEFTPASISNNKAKSDASLTFNIYTKKLEQGKIYTKKQLGSGSFPVADFETYFYYGGEYYDTDYINVTKIKNNKISGKYQLTFVRAGTLSDEIILTGTFTDIPNEEDN